MIHRVIDDQDFQIDVVASRHTPLSTLLYDVGTVIALRWVHMDVFFKFMRATT